MGHTRAREAGYGLLQILLAAVTIIPLIVVGVAHSIGEKQPRAEQAQAQFESKLAGVVDGIGQQLLPARQPSLKTRKRIVLDDGSVRMSDWFVPVAGQPYTELQFSRAPFRAGAPTEAKDLVYTLRYVRESTEKENGIDDDGDGLIDEGSVEMLAGERVVATLATRLRSCQFVVSGWKVRVAIEAEEPLERGYFLFARAAKTFTLRTF